MAKLIDTNLILRFLVNDNPKQAIVAENLFKNQKGNLILTDLALAEIVWTLQSYYNYSRGDIVEKLYQLVQTENFICNKILILNSLFLYLNHTISFVDAYLLAYCEEEKLEGIYSFDEGLDKIKSIKRLKP